MKSVITAVAAVAALALAAPASAQVTHQLEQSADAWQNDVGGKAYIVYACTALATPNALATAINECYIKNNLTGAKHTASGAGAVTGPANARVGGALSLPVASYDVCVASSAFYQDNVFLTEPLTCSRVARIIQ